MIISGICHVLCFLRGTALFAKVRTAFKHCCRLWFCTDITVFRSPRRLAKTSKKILGSLSLSSVQTKNSNKRLDTRNLGASKVGLTYTYTQTVAFPSPNVFAQNFGLLLFFLATDKPLQKAFITVSGEKVTKTKGKQSTAFPKPSSITKPSRAETRHTSLANPRAQTLCAH